MTFLLGINRMACTPISYYRRSPGQFWNYPSPSQATESRWPLKVGKAVNQFLVLTKTFRGNGQQFDLVWGVCYAIDNARVVFDLTHVSICVQRHHLVGNTKCESLRH
jgi:hypothetical protein